MVVNLNQILDAGENKFLPECKMVNDIKRIDKLVRISQQETIRKEAIWDSDEEEYIEGLEGDNPDYNPRPNYAVQKWIDADDISMNPLIAKNRKEKILADPNLKKSIYGFFNLIPFNPCVMINISPNWKGVVDPKNEGYQALLADTIQTYLNSCNRYTKYQYCLECGGDGDFLHAHIVAEINPAIHKSVMTHINKGNHKYEIIKAFKKLKGDEGLLKGKFAIQRIILNNETLRDDKLKYLYETNKPDGHQNKYDMDLVVGDFNYF